MKRLGPASEAMAWMRACLLSSNSIGGSGFFETLPRARRSSRPSIRLGLVEVQPGDHYVDRSIDRMRMPNTAHDGASSHRAPISSLFSAGPPTKNARRGSLRRSLSLAIRSIDRSRCTCLTRYFDRIDGRAIDFVVVGLGRAFGPSSRDAAAVSCC